MRPISPALLQAATSWAARPVAQAIIEDRRLRPQVLHAWPGGYDDSPTAMFHNGSLLMRACVDAAGQLLIARVTEPEDPSAWESWEIAASGARPGADVAVGWWAPGTWALLYEGAGGDVLCRTSADDGEHWSAAASLHTPAVTPSVALWGRWALVQEGALHAYHWTGTSWAGPYTLAIASAPAGVAVWYDAAGERLHALYGSGGRIWHATLDASLGTPAWAPPRVLYPGGDGPASALAACGGPALAWVPAIGLVATWIAAHAGPIAGWRAPILAIARGPGHEHWGQLAPLAAPGTAEARWALAYDTPSATLYCGNRRRMLAAPAYDPALREWMRLGPVDLLSARWQATPGAPGSLHLELLDPSLAMRAPGEPGGAAACARPLAACRLRRGWRTAAGPETVDTPEWTILSAAFTEGLGGGRLVIEAVDAWGTLARHRPPEPRIWLERSVLWLLEEICAGAGLAISPEGAPHLSRVVPQFALHPHQTALEAVRSLLRLGQAVARPAEGGALAVLPLPGGAGAPAVAGYAGEIRLGRYGPAAPAASHVRVASPGWGAYGEAESLEAARAAGGRASLALTEGHITSAEWAGAVAAHVLTLEGLARADAIEVPLRPDLELWDPVELVAPTGALAGDDDGLRVITAIDEELCPARNRCASTLALGRPLGDISGPLIPA